MDFSYNSTQNIYPAVHIALDNEYLYKNRIATDAGLKINAVASKALESQLGIENVKTFVPLYKLVATAVPVLNAFVDGASKVMDPHNISDPYNISVGIEDKIIYLGLQGNRHKLLPLKDGLFLLGFVVMFGIFKVAIERLGPRPETLVEFMGPWAGALAPEPRVGHAGPGDRAWTYWALEGLFG